MSHRPRSGGRVLVASVVVVALALLMSACGGAGATSSGGTTATLGATVAPTPVSSAQLASIVSTRTKTFLHTARAFHRCDHAEWDSAGPAPCLAKARAETAAASAFLGDLQAVGSPAAYATAIKDLAAMKKAGAKIALRCAHGDDQPCDAALARFRADEQSVLWDLNASL